MALSSNYYQQIWWTGKGRVRFSDSLALGKASGLRNLTRKGIDTEILKLAWEKNREGKEMEKSWTNCEIAISEQFQISNPLKMLHVCLLSTNSEFSSALKSKVNDTLGRWLAAGVSQNREDTDLPLETQTGKTSLTISFVLPRHPPIKSNFPVLASRYETICDQSRAGKRLNLGDMKQTRTR